MTGHLIPEQRFDKNQKLVTRYVKPVGSTSGSDLSGASPMASLTAADPLLERLAGLIDDKRNEIALASLPHESIHGLKTIAENLTKDADAAVIWKLMNPKQSRGEGTVLADDIRGLAKYQRLQESVPLNETLSAVRGLWSYDYGEEQRIGEGVARVLVDAVSVVLPVLEEADGGMDYPDEDEDGEFLHNLDNYYSFFGGDMTDQGDGSLWVRNEEFVKLVKDHVDKADQIFAIIRDRKTIAPQTIRALIETDIHTSLVEGAL
jgi:hypothetical protein